MKRLFALAVVFILFSTRNQASSSSKSHFANEDGIREVVFRYLMSPKHFGSNDHKIYFFSLANSKDPSNEFIKRFAGHKPPVKAVSQSYWNPKPSKNIDEDTANALYAIKDKKTGQTGMIYRVGSIKWINKSKVEANGGYYSGVMSASNATYTVELKRKQWMVTKVTGITKS